MQTKPLTLEEFEAVEGDYELDEGRLVPVTPAGSYHAVVAGVFVGVLFQYAGKTRYGIAFSEGGCILQVTPATVLAPDAGFIRRERLHPGWKSGWFKVAPDVAVEVVSPSNTNAAMRRKARQYLVAGTRLVWIASPVTRTVVAWWADGRIETLQASDRLDGGDVLPGFRCRVGTLFPE